MNIYRHEFFAACPANGAVIKYELEIASRKMIHVEHIVSACALFKSGYHEAIADELHARFGGFHVMNAHHHGVDIETRRGFDEPDHGRLTQRVVVGNTVYEKGVEAVHAIKAVARMANEHCDKVCHD